MILDDLTTAGLAVDLGDARLDAPIEWLLTSRRALHACRDVGVVTVRDFLQRDRVDFAVVRGCGPRTFEDIDAAVRDFLSGTEAKDSGSGKTQLLTAVIEDQRALRAFRELGLTTVQQLLATPKEKLLAVRGFGPRTYERVMERVRKSADRRRGGLALLPSSLLRLRTETLGLERELCEALRSLGLHTVGDLLRAADLAQQPSVGPAGCDRIREALDYVLCAGIDQSDQSGAHLRSFAQLSARLLATLSIDAQNQLRQWIGFGGAPVTVREIARRKRCTVPEVKATLAAIQRRLQARAAPLLGPLREEGDRLLAAHAGLATPDCLQPGTLLHDAAHESGDSLLPFRLLCFCFPERFAMLGSALSGTPPHRVRALRKVLHPLVRPSHLPLRIGELEARLASRGITVERGVLLHTVLGFGLVATPEAAHGEVTLSRRDLVADRVVEILRAACEPMQLEDLMFHYRDRHRSCHKGRLLAHLRADTRLLEIGAERWSLRERHESELHAVAAEADRIAEGICAEGGRRAVAELVAGDATERTRYLIHACLRRDPRLRDLGRGEFCPQKQDLSGMMRDIHGALSRAMGELPVARFLENQDERHRRLIARLLRENRMFVEPSEDRVDLLTNYPLNAERLQELRRFVAEHLRARGGYGTLSDVLRAIQSTPLGGAYLTEHLLGDVLRRHGAFEVLPGGFIAGADLGLGGWIQHKAREVLRQADLPLTPQEIITEVPELTEFADCLEQLLERDPLVQTSDTVHYRLV